MSTRRPQARRGSRPSGAQRRRTAWIDFLFSDSIAASGQSVLLISGTITTGVKPGATVVRTLISVTFKMDTANADSIIDVGLMMGTTEGIAAGAVPDPSTSGDNPGWMYRDRIVIFGSTAETPESFLLQKDIRSMRKFGAADRDVAWITDVNAASAVSVNGLIRMLIKLP